MLQAPIDSCCEEGEKKTEKLTQTKRVKRLTNTRKSCYFGVGLDKLAFLPQKWEFT